mmetsp:Transcript_34137/g.59585  ORF Transcript_34137/g.59585 Transcript_34137/m.59585 type:complete len:167 (-) Transcript_34137:1736-2236(-)
MIILHVVTSFWLSFYNPPLAIANLVVLALMQFPYLSYKPAESIKSSLAMMAPLVVLARLGSFTTYYLAGLSLQLTSAWFRMYHAASAKNPDLLGNGLARSVLWLLAYGGLVWEVAIHYKLFEVTAFTSMRVSEVFSGLLIGQMVVWGYDLVASAHYIISHEKSKSS